MREGLIPAVLGTVVTASSAAFLGSKYKMAKNRRTWIWSGSCRIGCH